MRNTSTFVPALFLALCLAFHPLSGFAHGEGPWNDFMIDSKNGQVELTLEQVRKVVADIVLETEGVIA